MKLEDLVGKKLFHDASMSTLVKFNAKIYLFRIGYAPQLVSTISDLYMLIGNNIVVDGKKLHDLNYGDVYIDESDYYAIVKDGNGYSLLSANGALQTGYLKLTKEQMLDKLSGRFEYSHRMNLKP